jgi:hypothetical protein
MLLPIFTTAISLELIVARNRVSGLKRNTKAACIRMSVVYYLISRGSGISIVSFCNTNFRCGFNSGGDSRRFIGAIE